MVDKPLFTPGPLTTSATVKAAMGRDLGSRDTEFIGVIRDLRNDLLKLADVSQADGWEAVLMQGSGTFSIESVISSITPTDGKWLVIINGAYGARILKIIERHGIAAEAIRCRKMNCRTSPSSGPRWTEEDSLTCRSCIARRLRAL